MKMLTFDEFQQCVHDALGRLVAMQIRRELPDALPAGDWLEQLETVMTFPRDKTDG